MSAKVRVLDILQGDFIMAHPHAGLLTDNLVAIVDLYLYKEGETPLLKFLTTNLTK